MKSNGHLAGCIALAVALGAVSAGWWYSASRSHARLAALEEQVANLTTENNRLNQVAQEHSKRKAPEIDPELARLRSEVVRLRTQIRAGDPKPAAASAPRASIPAPPPAAEAPKPKLTAGRAIAKADWAFSGYDTPAAALQSLLWASRQGDATAFLASFAADNQEEAGREFQGKTAEEISSMLTKEVENIDELRPDQIQETADGGINYSAITSVKQDSNGTTSTDAVTLHFRKIGGQWKATLSP